MQWAGGMLACFKMGRLWSKTDRQTETDGQQRGHQERAAAKLEAGAAWVDPRHEMSCLRVLTQSTGVFSAQVSIPLSINQSINQFHPWMQATSPTQRHKYLRHPVSVDSYLAGQISIHWILHRSTSVSCRPPV